VKLYKGRYPFTRVGVIYTQLKNAVDLDTQLPRARWCMYGTSLVLATDDNEE
jgi:hypothetical protein